ncbi:MAG: hypothetical protein WC657_00810 [Candidatus Paceibacterota bacterium]
MSEDRKKFLLDQRLANGLSLIVVCSTVYATLGGKTHILTNRNGIISKKHGSIDLRYAEDSWGVVRHRTVSRCATQILFIPPKKRMNVSNGAFKVMDVNYQSFVEAHHAGIITNPQDKTGKDRVEFGHKFVWCSQFGCWECNKGNTKVFVSCHPEEPFWRVSDPADSSNSTVCGFKCIYMIGGNSIKSEYKAFEGAVKYLENK